MELKTKEDLGVQEGGDGLWGGGSLAGAREVRAGRGGRSPGPLGCVATIETRVEGQGVRCWSFNLNGRLTALALQGSSFWF